MIEESKKAFEFPLIELVKLEINAKVLTGEDDWYDDSWAGGEFEV